MTRAGGGRHPLDNPAWPALTTHHARFAEGVGPARRYVAGTSFFAAVDGLDDAAWSALASLTGIDGIAVLARTTELDPPPPWEVVDVKPGHQLVASDLRPPNGPQPTVVVLGPEDGAAMVALARLTKPGPFFERTPELGTFRGVFEGGRLVAMAGERLRLPGHVEVSGVCTHPDARGRGLAAALTHAVAGAAFDRGDTPFLHVAEGNEVALRVYQRLGFVERTTISFTVLRLTAG